MKKTIMLLFVLMLIPVYAVAENEKPITDEIISEYAKLYGDEINDGLGEMENTEIEKLVPGFSVDEIIVSIAKGENIFSVREICARGISLLTAEVRSTVKLMVIILALSVMCTYLVNLQSGFGAESMGQTAFFTCYAIVSGVGAAAFFEVVKCGHTVIENISVFMKTLVPVVLACLVSGGAVISATAFETVLMAVIEITEWVIETIFLPILMMTAALNIVNNMSERLNAEKLVQAMNKTVKWGLGILLTLFVGITGLQGIATGGADGLTVKVTRFAAANLIPVVGGVLSETVETVMNCSIVIKNSVGIIGIIIVVLVSLFPIIKTAACLIMFRLSAAVIQPISDKKIVKCISELADSVSCVLSMMVAVTIMFIIIITITINVSNSAMMLGR